MVCLWHLPVLKNRKKQEQQKEEEYQDAFDKVDELQQKAAKDTGFAKSSEFNAQMEKAAIELSKKTSKLSENQKLLLEFETSIKALKQSTNDIKQQPSLSKNKSFLELVQNRASKVREYQQALKKAPLTPDEKKKFEELNHQ